MSKLVVAESKIDLRAEALGGLAAGVIGTVIGYPLDLVKTRMQTSKTKGNNMFTLGLRIVRKGELSCLEIIANAGSLPD